MLEKRDESGAKMTSRVGTMAHHCCVYYGFKISILLWALNCNKGQLAWSLKSSGKELQSFLICKIQRFPDSASHSSGATYVTFTVWNLKASKKLCIDSENNYKVSCANLWAFVLGKALLWFIFWVLLVESTPPVFLLFLYCFLHYWEY